MTPQEAIVSFMEQYRNHIKPLIEQGKYELANSRFHELRANTEGLYGEEIERLPSGSNFLITANILERRLDKITMDDFPSIDLRLEAYSRQAAMRRPD